MGRLPRPTPISLAELVLLAVLAVQAARLVWTVATPVGPVGDWKAAPSLAALADDGGALASFDPFFRLAEVGQATVTGLELKLHGVREDRATGRGSAIIALPDGRQASFAVGDEVVPGVRLAEVGFDHVVIDRNGSREQIFLDQSEPAESAAQTAPAEAGPPPPEPGPPAAATPAPSPVRRPPPSAGAPIQLQPRVSNGRVTGIVVSPGGDGQAFRAAGFAPGDVIVAVDGQRVSSMEQARSAIRRAGGEVTVVVDRAGRAVPMRVRLDP